MHGILSDKNLISRGAVLSNLKSIYNVFTVFNRVPLNQCQTVSKTLFCSMVYLNRLFLKFCDVVAPWICWEVNSTGDIPYTEMSVHLQSDLYGMGKVHDLHVKCYNCVCSVLV